ncbi:MAG: hypothetical protein HC915_17500 [Anaerolineae bacterium]|nr:hypothetical protein [Anaerolineae bacterium]
MAYRTQWLIQRQVLLFEPFGVVTPEDVRAYNAELGVFIAQAEGKLHVVADTLQVERIEATLGQARQNLIHLNDPRLGWSLFVVHNRVVRMMAGLLMQFVQGRHRIFQDRAACLIFLQQVEPTLDWAALG